MNINKNFVKEDDILSPIEEEIICNYINQLERKDYSKAIAEIQDLDIIYALSDLRENIINWYEFQQNSSILQIGANFGELTGYLCSKVENVIAVEKSLKKCEAIAKRYQDVDNLEILAGNIKDIELNQKFDYIIIEDNPNHLKDVKKYSKPDGKIIILTDNKFGITYFAGAKGKDELFGSICEEKEGVFGKYELETLIQSERWSHYKFYYPLPNYKITNVIFSDDYLPNSKNTKLLYNALYNKGSNVVFDELKAIKQLTLNHQFPFFANSYWIEISNAEKVEKQAKFISYNNNRKSEYRLVTKIYDDYVIKQNTTKASMEHMEQMKKNIKNLTNLRFNLLDTEKEHQIESKFVAGYRLDEMLINKFLENNIDEAIDLIHKWYSYVKERLTVTDGFNQDMNIEPKYLDGLTLIKEGYIDLVFENTFYEKDEFVFFDQEWYIENIPIEYILYRAINNLYIYSPEIEYRIGKRQLLEKFGIAKYQETFQQIEECIQSRIIDSKMMKVIDSSYQYIKNINTLLNEIENFKKEDNKKEKIIQELQNEDRKKARVIQELRNEDSKKAKVIQELQNIIQDLKQEEMNKSDYIKVLENIKNEKENEIANLNHINLEKDEIINELNEIIKVKDNQISIYENMKAVKLVKKLRGNK